MIFFYSIVYVTYTLSAFLVFSSNFGERSFLKRKRWRKKWNILVNNYLQNYMFFKRNAQLILVFWLSFKVTVTLICKIIVFWWKTVHHGLVFCSVFVLNDFFRDIRSSYLVNMNGTSRRSKSLESTVILLCFQKKRFIWMFITFVCPSYMTSQLILTEFRLHPQASFYTTSTTARQRQEDQAVC